MAYKNICVESLERESIIRPVLNHQICHSNVLTDIYPREGSWSSAKEKHRSGLRRKSPNSVHSDYARQLRIGSESNVFFSLPPPLLPSMASDLSRWHKFICRGPLFGKYGFRCITIYATTTDRFCWASAVTLRSSSRLLSGLPHSAADTQSLLHFYCVRFKCRHSNSSQRKMSHLRCCLFWLLQWRTCQKRAIVPNTYPIHCIYYLIICRAEIIVLSILN